MFRNYYRILIETKLTSLNLFDYLDLAKKYDKVRPNIIETFIRTEDGFDYTIPEYSGIDAIPVFVNAGREGDTEIYCAFYKNLFFEFHYNDKLGDRVLTVSMKDPEDEWRFRRSQTGEGCDVANPTNVHAEVYVDYNVDVLHRTRCFGNEYESGSWNKAFYNTFMGFLDKMEGITEKNIIKNAYR